MTPLNREQLKEIWQRTSDELPTRWADGASTMPFYVEYARAIEAAHQIGE